MRQPDPLLGDERLNEREIAILRLLADGLSNREISERLSLSPETIKWYNKQLFSKLGVTSRARAVALADKHGLLAPGAESASIEAAPSRHNLPAPLTSYIPRPREASEIRQLLKTSRLVVLTGAGGTGKTRLALRVASELLREYRDGIWLTELAPVGQAERVADSVCHALGVTIPGVATGAEALKRYLQRKHLLLVLDNFEHLLEAAPLVGEILAAAPQTAILATSREPLRIYGEQDYPLEPLPLPSGEQLGSLEQLLANPSVDLFLQRARAAQPSLPFDLGQAMAAARICQRLDGLPLAIELAASMAGVFAPTALAERIVHDMWSLPDGPRDAPARHRTLHTAIDWSYRLLDEAEKGVFKRMSVFRGGAALDGVEEVCRHDLPTDTARRVESLVAKNLLQSREGPHGEPRFTMLETIREYAAGRLLEAGETEQARRAHASHFARLAEQADEEFRGRRNPYWMRRLPSEHQNLEAALDWSLFGAEISYGVRIAAALDGHWYYNGYSTDGRRWIALAIERGETVAPALRARLLRTAGNLAYALDDQDQSIHRLKEASSIYRGLGDDLGGAWCDAHLALGNLGSGEGLRQGLELAQRALSVFERSRDKPGQALALNILGELTRLQGEDATARRHYEACLALAQETGEVVRQAIQHENLGILAYRRGEYEEAERSIRRGLSLFRQLGTTYGLATSLASLAGPAARLGRLRDAARLLGAANAQLQSLGIDQQPADQPEIGRYLEEVLRSLGRAEFQAEWQAGQAMTIRDAVEWVLGNEASPTGNPGQTPG